MNTSLLLCLIGILAIIAPTSQGFSVSVPASKVMLPSSSPYSNPHVHGHGHTHIHLRTHKIPVTHELLASHARFKQESFSASTSFLKYVARSQQPFSHFSTLFQTASLSSSSSSSSWSSSSSSSSSDVGYFVHVKGPVTSKLISDINSGISPYRLGDYIPDNTFTVVGPNTRDFQHVLHSMQSVLVVEPILKEFKLDPSLEKYMTSMTTLSQKDEVVDSDIKPRLRVHLLPLRSHVYRTHEQSSELASIWSSQFKDASFTSHGSHYIDIIYTSSSSSSSSSSYSSLLFFLLSRSEVGWIEKQSKLILHNKYASRVLQSDSNVTHLYDHGLKGDGQVLALGDTGIDHDSCFFRDPNHPTPIGFGSAGVNMNHRKIVAYRPFADNMDDANGHGTHVAGTYTGSIYTDDSNTYASLSPYNGMAPNAKLAMYDFKRVGSEDLDVPTDIYNQYYGDSMIYTKASISSNSWGAPDGEYGSYCIETDRFVRDNPNYLILFAAGNYGEDAGYNSISSPGISKNVLTVGSSKSSADSFISQGFASGFEVSSPSRLIGKYYAVSGTVGQSLSGSYIAPDTPLIVADPIDACSPLKNGNIPINSIVLVRRGTCLFSVKARMIESLPASMMLVFNNDDGPAFPMGANDAQPSRLICAMIPKTAGENFLNAIQNGESVKISGPVVVVSDDMNENSLSSFSSRGPTFGSRLKPDILAPGEMIASVRSDGSITSNQCPSNLKEALLSMQGTSMATPAAAGTAALIRQYFMEGYYPTGSKTPADSFTPTAALLKAMMIHSAVSIGGQVTTTPKNQPTRFYSVQPAPSLFQGYGRALMSNVLLFDHDYQSLTRPRIKVYNSLSLSHGESIYKCFSVVPPPSSSPSSASSYGPVFRATITWMDPPIPANADYALVNDLDLSVLDTSNQSLYMGNLKSNALNGNPHLLWDTVNNVEMVSLSTVSSPLSFFLVHVYGSNVPISPQVFSLIVSGGVDEVELSQCSTTGFVICPNHCSGHGNCNKQGRCECEGTYTGSDCSMLALPFVVNNDAHNNTIGYTIVGSVTANGWSYYYVDIDHSMFPRGLSMLLTRQSLLGDPDLYVSSTMFPTISTHEYASTNCDSCANNPPSPIFVPSLSGASTRTRYYVGVYGYCCDDTDFQVEISAWNGPNSTPINEVPTWVAPLVILLVLGACALAVYTYKWWKARRRNQDEGLRRPRDTVGGERNSSYVYVPPQVPKFVPLREYHVNTSLSQQGDGGGRGSASSSSLMMSPPIADDDREEAPPAHLQRGPSTYEKAKAALGGSNYARVDTQSQPAD